MRVVADVNIAPRTVERLRSHGHDVVRVSAALSPSASDREIVEYARREGRAALTQHLDLTTIVALSGGGQPSVLTLRLPSSRVDAVNASLEAALPALEDGGRRQARATLAVSSLNQIYGWLRRFSSLRHALVAWRRRTPWLLVLHPAIMGS